jgi:exodeoxyribonuclease V alpha subunit
MCLSNNFSIVTGIAGTGKTSIIKAVVDIFESNNMKCLLCTPTGRAARRLSEVTDHEAQTVHSAYKIFPLEERDEFAVSEYKRTEDVLIIDEFSMIELIIFNIVLEKTSSNTKIILVGDPKQLPSVGVGSLLKDFIESKKIPVHNLTQIFRQGKNSKIIETAFDINRGVMPEIPTIFEYNNQDIVFFEQKDSSKILDTIQIIIEKFLLERGYSNNDINIISPLRRFDLGSIELNKYLKNILKLYKFDSDEINGNIFNFSLGDKVIQTRNIIDYGCGSDKPVRIYNGDIGIITEINDSECNVLFYDSNNVIQYNKGNMDDIELAYAISVHKSQGSEYPIIILICHENVGRMLRRDIYYTGVTRAKNLCIFVGTKSALKTAIKNDYELKRYSYMKERLNGKQD